MIYCAISKMHLNLCFTFTSSVWPNEPFYLNFILLVACTSSLISKISVNQFKLIIIPDLKAGIISLSRIFDRLFRNKNSTKLQIFGQVYSNLFSPFGVSFGTDKWAYQLAQIRLGWFGQGWFGPVQDTKSFLVKSSIPWVKK